MGYAPFFRPACIVIVSRYHIADGNLPNRLSVYQCSGGETFVSDYHVERISRKAVKTVYKALNACYHDFFPVALFLADFKTDRAIIIFRGLVDKFLPVRKNQNPALTGNAGENDCLALT